MKHQFFCETVQRNDRIIKFQMISANNLKEAIDILNQKYTDIAEWTIKNMFTGSRYTKKT